MADCIFCKLARHEIPTEVLFEDEQVMAFTDLHPKAPVHILVIPKEHLTDVNALTDGHQHLAGKLLTVAKQLAAEHGVADSGYRLQINVGKDGGQVIPHLHLHLLGGRAMKHEVV